MIVSDVFARVVEVIGGATVLVRRAKDGAQSPAFGSTPQIPAAKSQGALPTLKMPTARGWSAGQKPVAAPGLKVNAFATDLEHPRWIEVLPGGDVLVAEAKSAPGGIKSIFDYAIASTMRRAGAAGTSANRITRLRDADGDGAAEVREVFLDRLNQPFGMALVDDTFYVGNTDGLVAFRFDRDTGRPSAQVKNLPSSSPAAIGREASWQARTARSSTSASARRATSASAAWPPKKVGLRSTRSTSQAARTASSPRACATPSGLPSSRSPGCFGPS